MPESICYTCGKYKLCTKRLQAMQPILKCDQHGTGSTKQKKKKK